MSLYRFPLQQYFHCFRYDTTNGDPCNEKSPKKKKTAVLSVAIVVPVLMVALLVSTLLVYYFCRKQGRSTLLILKTGYKPITFDQK